MSAVPEYSIELNSLLPKGTDVTLSMTRAKFDSLCQPLFDQTMQCVDKALADAHLTKEEISEVILVGGSTRIPKIQSMLQNYFHGKTLNKSINPDEAVACGAAIQAAILNNDPHVTVQDMLLIDVNPLSIGLGQPGDVTLKVIPRNTPIPVKKEIDQVTSLDYETRVDFRVFEGEQG